MKYCPEYLATAMKSNLYFCIVKLVISYKTWKWKGYDMAG